MKRRTLLATSVVAAIAPFLGQSVGAQQMDDKSQRSLDTAMAFMDAMGKGDMEGVSKLMAEDMVWHNKQG